LQRIEPEQRAVAGARVDPGSEQERAGARCCRGEIMATTEPRDGDERGHGQKRHGGDDRDATRREPARRLGHELARRENAETRIALDHSVLVDRIVWLETADGRRYEF
jgi:hypothetical protein